MAPFAVPTNTGLLKVCLLSLIFHVLVFGGVFAVMELGENRGRSEVPIVRTRLVKLGKPRDPKLLPRIAPKKEQQKPKPTKKTVAPPEPTPPKKEAAPPKPEPAPEPPPKPDAPSATDILRDFQEKNEETPQLDDLINDKIGPLLEEGSKEGSEIGEEISGRLKASYNDHLLAKMKSHFSNPQTLTDQERMFLKAILVLTIQRDGSLGHARISKSSGNASYDNAVLAAAQKAAPFNAPPTAVAPFYETTGVGIEMCPISCQ